MVAKQAGQLHALVPDGPPPVLEESVDLVLQVVFTHGLDERLVASFRETPDQRKGGERGERRPVWVAWVARAALSVGLSVGTNAIRRVVRVVQAVRVSRAVRADRQHLVQLVDDPVQSSAVEGLAGPAAHGGVAGRIVQDFEDQACQARSVDLADGLAVLHGNRFVYDAGRAPRFERPGVHGLVVAGRVGQRHQDGGDPADADLGDDAGAGPADDQVAGGVKRFDFVRVIGLVVSRQSFAGEFEPFQAIAGVGLGVVVRAFCLADDVDDVDVRPGQQPGQRVDHGPVDGTGARRSAEGEYDLRVGRQTLRGPCGVPGHGADLPPHRVARPRRLFRREIPQRRLEGDPDAVRDAAGEPVDLSGHDVLLVDETPASARETERFEDPVGQEDRTAGVAARGHDHSGSVSR